MRKSLLLVLACAAALGLGVAGCGAADKCPGKEVCGGGCMPVGASCCPSGAGYCDGGQYCGTDNLCHTGGGGGGSTCAAYTCINNLCSPGLWCCPSGHTCNTAACGCN